MWAGGCASWRIFLSTPTIYALSPQSPPKTAPERVAPHSVGYANQVLRWGARRRNSFSARKPCQIVGLREGFDRDPRVLPHSLLGRFLVVDRAAEALLDVERLPLEAGLLP